MNNREIVETLIKQLCASKWQPNVQAAERVLCAAQETGVVSNELANAISQEYGLGLRWE